MMGIIIFIRKKVNESNLIAVGCCVCARRPHSLDKNALWSHTAHSERELKENGTKERQ